MTVAQVAIVGRPNVGKSSLLNRLARRRVSIVDATPGVTRDRVSCLIELEAPADTPEFERGGALRLAEFTDTGGYGVYTAEGKRFNEIGADLATLTDDIETQIRIAIADADLILLVIDAQAGLTSLDRSIATLLREGGARAPILAVANKVDGESWLGEGVQAASLGFGDAIGVSATNGFGVRALLNTIYMRMWSDPDAPAGHAAPDAEMKMAIVGKRNAGKSTLINALAGAPRVIVSEIAGTTRDSIDVRFEIEGRRLLAIDTAGVRKRKSFADDIEYFAYHRMLQSIHRCNVAVLLVDATQEVSQVDKKLTQELQRSFKPTIIAINKCDEIDPARADPKSFEKYLTEQLRGFDYAPIVFISALEGEGLRDLAKMAFNLYEQASHREPTARLNTVIESILDRRGPSSRLGTQAKLLYATQVGVNPPTIVLVVNDPSLFRGQYERYLLNRLREELPFSEVPIRLVFTKRKRISLSELKQRRSSDVVVHAEDPAKARH